MAGARESWSSHAGFIFVSIGSAVGIGNIWRYPYIVGTNGGGAFLLTYIIVLFTFGLSFMVLELFVGKYYKTSVIECMKKINGKFKIFGIFMVGVTFAILTYYLVILGWVMAFFIMNITGTEQTFDEFTDTFFPVISFIAIAAVNFFIINRRLRNGIEKISKFAIILLLTLLIPLTVIGISLPDSQKGIEFYLTPDFNKIQKPEVWSVAFGQAFFSLSIGMGVLLTFGSYLKSKRSLISSSIIIIIADLSIALLAGLMIFSMVFALGMDPSMGIPLIFNVMPSVFENFEYEIPIASSFFFLLLLAGITSSISMFQVPISALEDTLGFSKNKASSIVLILAIILGLPSALSYSNFELTISGFRIFDIVDTFFGTYGLAISAAVFSIIVTWFMDRKKIIESVNEYSRVKIPQFVVLIVKFALPLLIIATIIVSLTA